MNSRLASSVGLIASWKKIERTDSLHRPGLIQGVTNLMLHRPHDLTIELPYDVGDVPSSGVEPGQVDQDGRRYHRQQHEAGQYCAQPELAGRSTPSRASGVPRQSGPITMP